MNIPLDMTQAQRHAHVQAYLKSGLSQKMYCEQTGLKPSSFKNWVKRYRSKSPDKFIPVATLPSAMNQGEEPLQIEIRKADYQISLSSSDSNQLKGILVEILSCI